MQLFSEGRTLRISTEQNPDYIGVQASLPLTEEMDCPIQQILKNPRAVLNFGGNPDLPRFFPLVEKLGWPIMVEFRYRNLAALKVHAMIGSNIITVSMPTPDKLARRGTTNFIQRGSSTEGTLNFQVFSDSSELPSGFSVPIDAEATVIDDEICHVHLKTDPYDDKSETRIGNLASVIRDPESLRKAIEEGLINKGNTLHNNQPLQVRIDPAFTFRYLVNVRGCCEECDDTNDPSCDLAGCTNCQAVYRNEGGTTVVTIVDALCYMWCQNAQKEPCPCKIIDP